MSSYLTIYGVPKNEGKPIDIVSFSRSHCIYSAICDEVNVAWAGESEVYTNLNTSDLDGVIHSIEEDIKSSAERLTLYEKYAANNPDYIEEIILLRSIQRSLLLVKIIVSFYGISYRGHLQAFLTSVKFVVTQVNMKFKLEFTFDISDSSLLIDANDGRSEEYTSLEDVPEDTLMDVVYNYLDGVIEGITYDQITVKKL